MAKVFPFQPYRYSHQAGPLENLVTQPYDKISVEMQARYLSLSPWNLVRIILGPRFPSDSEADNVYTRAREYLNGWIAEGILVRERQPSLFAYFQEFAVPDSGERLLRKGFIGLGAVEDYSEGVVHRHEQTLSGPKKDRLELLRHTGAHCGHIFMLYPDASGEIDAVLDGVSQGEPLACVVDEYQARHSLWRISEGARIARIQGQMSDKKLLIADGHHRYETALAFRDEHPELADARKVMMTFVNMYSPGLKILATHRLVQGLAGFQAEKFLRQAAEASFRVGAISSVEALQKAWAEDRSKQIRIGAFLAGSETIYLLETERGNGALDLEALHKKLLGGALGIGEEAVREEKHLRYIRGIEPALEAVRRGSAQIAFLVEPTAIEQVARIAFSGGVMPQKSTDFYPKLLSGLTIYKLER
jgi:uncharacterized protein (DUF1015 family)